MCIFQKIILKKSEMTSYVQLKIFPPLDSNPAYYNEWVFRIKALLRQK